ncbi:MAG TPA: hypothetical protein V6C76_11920 [Drouetiella sp.]
MARFREKVVHPFIQRIWDKLKISGPKQAAEKSQTPINIMTSMIDVDRTDAFIDRIHDWAHRQSMETPEFLRELADYLDAEKARKKIS